MTQKRSASLQWEPENGTDSETNSDILFITGAPKTATSTLVGMLNCHPDIFIAYEWKLNQGMIAPRAKKFLDKFPHGRYLFRYSRDLVESYTQLKDFLREQGFSCEIIGDKDPDLNSLFLKDSDDFRVIFSIRDIRTWICKDKIVNPHFYTTHDLVPAAIDYSTHFLRSFLLSNILHIRMEDIIHNNLEVVKQIESFLRIELSVCLTRWWEKVGKLDEMNGMYFDKWWTSEGHRSSTIAPNQEDTEVVLGDHPFWDALLPIFDRYYNGINQKFDASEIHRDIKRIESLAQLSPVSLEEAYRHFESRSFGDPDYRGIDGNRKRRTSLKYALRRTIVFVGHKLLQMLDD